MEIFKLAHTDFWGGYDCALFKWVIEQLGYAVTIVDPSSSPDLLIYSVFGNSHRNYNCKKLFFTGENRRPNMDECDFALSFDFLDHPRHYRFPLYTYHRWSMSRPGELSLLSDLTYDSIFDEKNLTIEELFAKKPNFCAFVQGNPNCPIRNEFFHKLNSRKRVDSGGTLFNNMGTVYGSANEKTNLLRSYRYCISFENASHNGYLTEKIIDPMLVQTVPIYWGSESVENEFNEKSFINANKMTLDETVDKIMWLEENPLEYYKMWKEPFMTEELPQFKIENLIEFFKTKVL